ncbi:TonB-dependent receptor plug domain-containing protein [Neptuniibacter sp. QD72_48]|uniref:TonB-dependent receptor plug domain-containing protein n=1 Tax=unclassified Neptuniibacter TaxID=2630693 RepID=UPI0039F50F96
MDLRKANVPVFMSGTGVCLASFISILSSNLFAADLSNLSITSLEDLLNQEVTSVSKKQENLYTAPAAVYVITAEDIRRRGVTNIPEALAMAPGLLVRSIDGNKWSIGARGFSGIYSNKLLVQIDGRSIYTPTFSGVYWGQHNIPIHEVDRIEVIRGSGATLWGANAVNGIINIITKHSSDSQGGRFQASIGNEIEGSASARFGGQVNEDAFFRINAQMSNRDDNSLSGSSGYSHDASKDKSFAFRLDGSADDVHSWELSGGYHDNKQKQTLSVLNLPPPVFSNRDVEDEVDMQALYLNGQWQYQHEMGGQSQFQIFIDNYEREELFLAQEVTTFDLDYQLTLPVWGKHNVIMGVGYRNIDADYTNSYAVGVLPSEVNLDLFSAFIQDEYSLVPNKLSLTLGSKFENHEYTGWEIQPNIRLGYTPAPGHFSWASISRAVRTPSIAERGSLIQGGITVPISTWVQGNPEIDSEKVTSYELGYRYFSSNQYTVDLSFFYNDYDNYLSFEQINPIVFQMDNKLSGKSYGMELSTVWQPMANWQLAASYSYVDVDMLADLDGMDPLSESVLNEAFAKNMVKLHSAWDINQAWSLDAWLYYIDEVPVPSNFALFEGISIDDALTSHFRLAWRASKDIELSLTAKNAFGSNSIESVGETFSAPAEIDRSATLSVVWDF